MNGEKDAGKGKRKREKFYGMDLYGIFRACGAVATDSRTVRSGELFFGLKGENFDGSEYAFRALEAGAARAVVAGGSEAAHSGDARVIAVPDPLEALQELARIHRRTMQTAGGRLPVIGLTGTNGKTTTKNLIARVLSAKYRVTATEGNLNNDIGVPLSLLRIGPDTQLAVIEMGANHPDDIKHLVRVCEPDYGLVTNVGKAHLLGFGSFEGVKRAKGQLYDYIHEHGGSIFINADDPVLEEMAAAREGLKRIEYGVVHEGVRVLPASAGRPFLRLAFQPGASAPSRHPGCTGEAENVGKEGCGEALVLETRLAGAYNAANVMAAIAVGRHFGVPLEDAVRAIGEYVPDNNRSQLEKTERNLLIEDAYNANPTSMAAALDHFSQVEAARKAALLGDMRELGAESVPEHIAVLRKAESLGLDLLCLVGEEFGKALGRLGPRPDVKWFATSEDLAGWLRSHPVSGTTILVKGSRGIRMEKVLPAL